MPGVEGPPHLGRFIPRLLGDYLASAARLRGAGPQSLQGVVLFVDIAESTSMTDRVSASGPEGAELLGAFLSRYFTELIGIVAAHGGDVLRIDGDAIIAFWRSGEAPAHLQAARAAMAVRDVQLAWPVEPPERLRHRIALVTGSFNTLVLSGEGRRSFLVFAGEPLGTIGRIMRSGEPGDIILDDGMRQLLQPVATIAPFDAAGSTAWPAARLDRLEGVGGPSLADTGVAGTWPMPPGFAAGAFVPRIIVERSALGLSDWLAEFRVVSVVYARLGDADLSGAFAAGRLQASFDIAAAAADAMGVEISDIVADEKGVIAIVVCGLPPFGSEGNSTQAVEIARRIRNDLAVRGIACSVGVATGRIFCGDVGNNIRREYVLRGPVMNYGARLMEAADDNVLCDATTVQVASARFAFSAADAIPIRGREAPLTIHQLIEARTAGLPASYTTGLHGRSQELAALLARLEQLKTGTGGLIAIEAEPGAGKSRLLAEFASMARQRGCGVIEACTDAIEQTTAYFVFRQVLRQLLATPGDGNDPPLSRLRQLLREALAGTALLPRAALIEDVMPLGIEDPGLVARVRGAARRDGIEDIFVALGRRRAGIGPLMVLLDDLQWIDALSADLLLAANRRLAGLLIVVASRPPDPNGAQHYARVLDRAQASIALQRLDPIATTRMICELLRARAIPRRLAEFVHGQSEGLPIHAEQVLLSLREQGLVVLVEGRGRVTTPDLATASVPPKLREIIVGRIDRLSQADQLAAKVASVIGREFDVPALREIYPMPADHSELEASAERLSAALILAARGAGYAFRHAIIQEATYDLLSYAQRRVLHRAVAELIERRKGAGFKPHFAELAHHWEHAADPAKAFHYRLLAANLAIRGYANDDALMHAERAERLAERSHLELDASQSAQLAYVRGEACHALSRFAEAEGQLRASLLLRGIGLPSTRTQLAASALRQILLQALHRCGIVRGRRTEQDRERAKLSAHLHTRFAEHAYFMRDSLALVHGSLTALNLAESVNSYPGMIAGYGGLAIGLGTARMHPVARFYRDRSITAAERFGELPDQAFAHLLAGVYSCQAGDWKATRSHCTKGVALCEQVGDHFRRQSCRVIECFGAIATGDYARAEAGFAEFGADAETIDNPPVRAWVLAGASVLDMLRGQPPARTLARLELARDASLHRAELLLCDGLEAAALMRSGDADAAGRVAARALADMQDSVCTMGIAMYSVCAVADVFLALAERATPGTGRREDLIRSARAACHGIRQFAAQTRICRPLAGVISGRLALLVGRRRRAAAQFARALASAERLGMPLEQAICHSALATLRSTDPARRMHAGRSARIMRELGADPWRYANHAPMARDPRGPAWS